MKIPIQIVVIFLFATALETFLPWWCIAIAAFGGGYLFRSRQNFVAGFCGVALLWTLKAFWLDQSSATLLTEGIAKIFSINKPLLFLATAVVGGLVGGFAATAGAALKE